MHIVLGLIALVGAAYFWSMRARNAAQMTQELGDVASDVLSAARRFGFRRKYEQHPVDSLEDPKVAIAGIGLAFLEIGGLPSTEQHQTLARSLQSHLDLSHKDAEESLVLGRWLMTESGGPSSGLTRLTRRLRKLDAQGGFGPLMSVLGDIGQAADGKLSVQQSEALHEIGTIFRLT